MIILQYLFSVSFYNIIFVHIIFYYKKPNTHINYYKLYERNKYYNTYLFLRMSYHFFLKLWLRVFRNKYLSLKMTLTTYKRHFKRNAIF